MYATKQNIYRVEWRTTMTMWKWHHGAVSHRLSSLGQFVVFIFTHASKELSTWHEACEHILRAKVQVFIA